MTATQRSRAYPSRLDGNSDAKARQFKGWDSLIASPAFTEFLQDRGLEIKDVRSIDSGVYTCLEVEAVAIGAMLYEPSVIDIARKILHVRAFHWNRHRLIYASLLKQRQHVRGNVTPAEIDVFTTIEDLRSRGWLEDVGGAYLSMCAETCPTERAIDTYSRLIAEAAQRRAMLACSETLKEAVSLDGDHYFNFATATQQRLPFYSPSKLTRALRDFADAVDAIPSAGKVPNFQKLIDRPKETQSNE